MALVEVLIRIEKSVSSLLCCGRMSSDEDESEADEYLPALNKESTDDHTPSEEEEQRIYYENFDDDETLEYSCYNYILQDIMLRHEAEQRRKHQEALHCSWHTGRSTLREANATHLRRRVCGQGSRRAIARRAAARRRAAQAPQPSGSQEPELTTHA